MVTQHGCVGLFNAADELKPLEMLAQTGAGIPVRARIALGSWVGVGRLHIRFINRQRMNHFAEH